MPAHNLAEVLKKILEENFRKRNEGSIQTNPNLIDIKNSSLAPVHEQTLGSILDNGTGINQGNKDLDINSKAIIEGKKEMTLGDL